MTSSPLAFTMERLPTAIGTALVVTDSDGCLRALDWDEYEERMMRLFRLHYGEHRVVLREGVVDAQVKKALLAYFEGEHGAIDRIAVRTAGTDFQRDVWAALRTIACGSTLSYGALAVRIGRPAAVRAVGAANGANPVGIVVPCHRVIGADASLTGYGGGLQRKRWLLAHEGCGVA